MFKFLNLANVKRMKNKLFLLIIILDFSEIVLAQVSNTFSLSLGSISTQNSVAQPATSLSGQFEIVIPDNKESLNIYLAVGISGYLAEGLRLSSCSDCSASEYSGFDMGVKIRFEPQKAKIPFNVFTGFSRVVTKKRVSLNDISPQTIYFNPDFVGSRNYISDFWDLGIGLKVDVSDKIFFSAETLAGYSLDSNSDYAQGIGKYEFNLGLGIRF